VEILLGRQEINPDKQNTSGRTPLSFASGFGREGVVKIVLRRGGVNPDNPDNLGQVPLLFVAASGHMWEW